VVDAVPAVGLSHLIGAVVEGLFKCRISPSTMPSLFVQLAGIANPALCKTI
jgi:hypothetical protein